MGTIILGAGISGLSTAFHMGHENCVIYEADDHYGGLTSSETRGGFTWDKGPHVNYGNDEYVRNLFAESVNQDMLEFEPIIRNYFHGSFIDHPAQSNLYQVPEPLRTQCLESFRQTRAEENGHTPANYQEWIHRAFGPVFAEKFPAVYTRKYWTTDPANLGIDWLAFVSSRFPRHAKAQTRIFYPSAEDVLGGYNGPLSRNTFYAKTFRYPAHGGFVSFLRKMADGACIRYKKRLTKINFTRRRLGFADGTQDEYSNLICTMPLPVLIECAEDAPADVKEAASLLRATNILLVEVTADHPTLRDDHYLYIYDADKLSTRVTVAERFSPNNAPTNQTGLSAEVYGSAYKPLPSDLNAVASKVQTELVEMGLLRDLDHVTSVRVRKIPFAQIIFDHNRQACLDTVSAFLDKHGVLRLGRYAEWDYLMTHDCVMGSLQIAEEALRRIGRSASVGMEARV
jgi:protoporphyrinogen oxidase